METFLLFIDLVKTNIEAPQQIFDGSTFEKQLTYFVRHTRCLNPCLHGRGKGLIFRPEIVPALFYFVEFVGIEEIVFCWIVIISWNICLLDQFVLNF